MNKTDQGLCCFLGPGKNAKIWVIQTVLKIVMESDTYSTDRRPMQSEASLSYIVRTLISDTMALRCRP